MRILNLNNPEDLKALGILTVILFSTASLTTMLAFGSMVFSLCRGFGQLEGALIRYQNLVLLNQLKDYLKCLTLKLILINYTQYDNTLCLELRIYLGARERRA